MRPWVRRVDDAEAAVQLTQSILIEIFGLKPDQSLDVMHGSRRSEFETGQKLALVRERVRQVLATLIVGTVATDADGDFQLPLGDVRVTVAPRSLPDGPVIVRVFAVTNVVSRRYKPRFRDHVR